MVNDVRRQSACRQMWDAKAVVQLQVPVYEYSIKFDCTRNPHEVLFWAVHRAGLHKQKGFLLRAARKSEWLEFLLFQATSAR